MVDDTQRHGPEVLGDDAASAPPRRSGRGWLAGAVVAGLVASSVVGFGMGQRQTGTAVTGSPDSGTGDPASSLPALGAPAASSAGMDLTMAPWSAARVVFDSRGLSPVATAAPAFGFDPRTAYGKDQTLAAAAVFGLDGPARDLGGAWVVGSQDGTGPQLQLSADGWTSASYFDPAAMTALCVEPQPAPGAGTGGQSSPNVGAPPAEGDTSGTTRDPGMPNFSTCDSASSDAPKPLDPSTAQQRAADLIDTLVPTRPNGVTVSYEPSTDPGSGSTYVQASLFLDDQPIGVAWGLSFVGKRLSSFSGPLAPPVDLGPYPVVSPADAVDRLGDPRFGWQPFGPVPLGAAAAESSVSSNLTASSSTASSGAPGPDAGVAVSGPSTPVTSNGSTGAGSGPVTSDAQSDTQSDTQSDIQSNGVKGLAGPVTPPPVASPGEPIAWPVQQVTIVKASLGLAPTTLPNGAVVLVPTYTLRDASGATWSVLAVSTARLDLTADQPR